jgi:microcystin-dependent protein
MGKFLTADEPAIAGSFYILLTLPKSVEFRQQMKGALYELTRPEKWEEFGTLTPEDNAELWSKILASVRDMPMNEVGTFVYSMRATAPANWIPAQGGDLAMADWPELMEVYPTVLKNYPSTGRFTVPDMRGRQFVGDGTDTTGFNWQFLSIGGERQHTLTIAEMPVHNHGESIAIPAIINGGLEAPASAATASTGTTGAAGSGAAHNNMPPYGVCHMYLVGRLLP